MPITPTWKHFAAFLYDIFPILGIFFSTSLAVLIFRNGEELERYNPWFISLLLSELFFYYIYSWKKGGQTLGMRAWKFKITPNQPNQPNLTWLQATARFFVGIVSTALAGLGLFWKIFSKGNKSWMDLASNSSTRILDQ